MKIIFRLLWHKAGSPSHKAFKSAAAYQLFSDYCERVVQFSDCEVSGISSKETRGSGAKIWFCDRTSGSRVQNSEEIAQLISKLQNSGTKSLEIVVGGPDGFLKSDYERWNPELRWSFGPFTLPHELASIVAAEQIYRAYTILKKLPYHTAH